MARDEALTDSGWIENAGDFSMHSVYGRNFCVKSGGGGTKIVSATCIVRAAGVNIFWKFSVQNGAFLAIFYQLVRFDNQLTYFSLPFLEKTLN